MDEEVSARIKKFRKQSHYTQSEIASLTGVTREAVAAYESGRVRPNPTFLAELRRLGFGQEVSTPSYPVEQLSVPLTYIGAIAASSPVDWTDPFESEDTEFVPGHMVRSRGLFSCRVASDSMMPFLEPGDLCVFRADSMPRIGSVVLFRANDNRVTIKQLKHDGRDYYLHPLNTKYEDTVWEGTAVGYLVGTVRQVGKRIKTDYDEDGLAP